MKRPDLFIIFLLVTFAFASCDKEDKENISQLGGAWDVANDDPRLSVDGFVRYTFNADNSCSIFSYNALSGSDTTVIRKYVMSIDNRILTIYKTIPQRQDDFYCQQYYLLKLTSKEMKWRKTSESDAKSDMRLVKMNN